MSDNRNYAVGMKNQGGAPVYMEDLKLSERSAVPNAASIANLKFLLTTGDDEDFRTAIKSYIDESIRAALGPLVNNLDKGTAISRILGTDSNNDLGSITPSNLANVLGAVFPHNWVINSADTYITTGSWKWGGGGVDNPAHETAILLVFKTESEYIAQIVIATTNQLFVRFSGNTGTTWSTWREI